ncbi:MAG: c-type cytochrome [Gammaproteobacteria bacterium]
MRTVLFLSLWIVFPLQAEDGDLGKQLHDEHCTRCHTPDIYTREHRIVTSYLELAERVRQCELSNELTWFDEEINAVVDYLDANYYHFSK